MLISRPNWLNAATVFVTCFMIPVSTVSAQTCGPQMRVEFFESSPKDLFIIGNVSAPGWRVTELAILLEGSRGALLFDTAYGGAGLSVYQPLEIAESDIPVRLAEVQDGSRVLTLGFEPAQPLLPGGELTITIDLDDTVQLADLGLFLRH